MIRRNLKRLLRIATLALCGVLPPVQALEIGEAAPALVAMQPDGRALALASLRGQVVYVDFWASWCAPCLQAMPALDALQRRYGARGFAVIGVNVDTERKAALRMLERVGVGFAIVLDPQGRWPEAFGLSAMPSGYLLDRAGVVRFVKAGYMAKDLPQIEAAVLTLLGDDGDAKTMAPRAATGGAAP
ncbi:TlpA family protein disulfide reductase [Sinimarinibacterium thermocellulolyticum]|uniref:TlpA disulfide reductase family protein n=1 Tax=Sinimarinibacterium thermocellulolyticum TaxID=3170016 RepID=A0ABV2ACH2_9GAMM